MGKEARDRAAATVDLADLREMSIVRPLEVAAAGGHPLLLVGPPTATRGVMARLVATFLPPLSQAEAREKRAIYEQAGRIEELGEARARPLRVPLPSASTASLLGGGAVPVPGEVSLAHLGVLVLDELAAFGRSVLEALRRPLDERQVTLARARGAVTWPAAPQLVGTMRPCPCGYRGFPERACDCLEVEVRRYRSRVPLVDRFEIGVEVRAPHHRDRLARSSSAEVRDRVAAAWAIQRARNGGRSNAAMPEPALRPHVPLDARTMTTLDRYAERTGARQDVVSAVLRVARTLADLGGRARITEIDVVEALAFRHALDDLAGVTTER